MTLLTYVGIFHSFWGIFSGVVALALFSASFQMLNDMPSMLSSAPSSMSNIAFE